MQTWFHKADSTCSCARPEKEIGNKRKFLKTSWSDNDKIKLLLQTTLEIRREAVQSLVPSVGSIVTARVILASLVLRHPGEIGLRLSCDRNNFLCIVSISGPWAALVQPHSLSPNVGSQFAKNQKKKVLSCIPCWTNAFSFSSLRLIVSV